MKLDLYISLMASPVNAAHVFISASTVDEDASPADSIGTLSADFGTGPHTWSIVLDADSKFAIGGAGSDELVVRTGASFNYEAAASHLVTVRATDSLSATEDRVLNIAVNLLAPTIVTPLSDLTDNIANGPFVIDYSASYAGSNRTVFLSEAGDNVTIDTEAETITIPAEIYADTIIVGISNDAGTVYDSFVVTLTETNTAPTASDISAGVTVPVGTSPVMASSVPSDGGNIDLDGDFVGTFNGDILLGSTGTVSWYDITGDAIFYTYDVETDEGTGAGQIEISDTNELTLHHPVTDFIDGRDYGLIWDAGFITNLGGISITGNSDPAVLSFTATAGSPTTVSAHSTIPAKLVSYWELEEASGTRTDIAGSNDLTDQNTVTQTTGKQGNAALFTAANSEYLSITDAAQTGLGITGDISLGGWVNFASLPTDGNSMWFAGKWATAGNQRGYRFGISNTSGVYSLMGSISVSGAGGSAVDEVTHTFSPSTSTWYHVVWTYEASTAVQKIHLNGSEVASATGIRNSIHDSTTIFALGEVNLASHLDGALDEFLVADAVLTSTEVTFLYNSGSGRPYD